MKIFQRYILSAFFKALFLGLGVFLVIVLIEQIFEKINTVITVKAALLSFLEHILGLFPIWIVNVMPVSILLAVLFCLGDLSKNNEITALRASGVGFFDITKPLIFSGLLIAIFMTLFNELVVPPASLWSKRTWKIKIKKEPLILQKKYTNLIRAGANRRIYSIKYLDGESSRADNFMVTEFNSGFLPVSEIFAKTAVYVDDKWVLSSGIMRRFSKDGIVSEEKFDKKNVNFFEKIDYFFIDEIRSPEEMNYFQLKGHIGNMKKAGLATNKEEVFNHLKISLQFTNFIMVILGIPFGLAIKKAGRVKNFSLSLIIGFVFWGTISVGQALGNNGKIPPPLGAWLGNIIFGVIGILLLLRIYRK